MLYRNEPKNGAALSSLMMKLSPAVYQKYRTLLSLLTGYRQPVLALSGGLDSSFLAFAIKDAGIDCQVVTVTSVLVPEHDVIRAKALADQLGFALTYIDLAEDHLERIQANPENRCYICKKYLFTRIMEVAAYAGADGVFDGTTRDDMEKYRPGIRALKELGAISPLADAGLIKADIRMLCRYFNLMFAELPSSPCMATRFPYGEQLTPAKIRRVAQAETVLEGAGFHRFRVRSHGDLARIELPVPDCESLLNSQMMAQISRSLRELGFDYVTLDLEGFASGSMDKKIVGGSV